jgi:hypothetical protein
LTPERAAELPEEGLDNAGCKVEARVQHAEARCFDITKNLFMSLACGECVQSNASLDCQTAFDLGMPAGVDKDPVESQLGRSFKMPSTRHKRRRSEGLHRERAQTLSERCKHVKICNDRVNDGAEEEAGRTVR